MRRTLRLKKSLPSYHNRGGGAAKLLPLVCPLITRKKRLCPCTQKGMTRVMNDIWQSAGTRFFHDYKKGRGRTILDYLAHHWNGMEGTSCNNCNNLTKPHKNFTVYTKRKFEELRAHCTDVYRSLKSGLMTNLQFVRFVPRRRGLYSVPSTLNPGQMNLPYEGLAAGITDDGVLCGFYQEGGFRGRY